MQEMQEMWFWSLGGEDLLENGVAAHSSMLAWEIPWTEEAGGYSPWGHRIGQDLATEHTHMLY